MKTSNKILLAFFGLLLFSVTSMMVMAKTHLASVEVIKGNGVITKLEREVEPFREVKVGNRIHLMLQQGEEGLSLEGDENLLEHVSVEFENGLMYIHSDPLYRLKSSNKIIAHVGFDDLQTVILRGGTEISSVGELDLDDLIIEISGSSEGSLDMNADELDVQISGSADLALRGTVREVDYSISGAGSIRAADFESEVVDISVSGAGDAVLFVNETLDVSISGAGSVKYKGDAAVDQHISGAGSIERITE